MALNKVTVNRDWTLLASDVTEITFQNISSYPVYIAFSTGSGTEPSESYGLVYGPGSGELKKYIDDLTYLSGANCVWSKSVAGREETVVVETE